MESLGRAIDELAATEPDGLSDDQLHELVVGLEREESRLAALRARHLAAWDPPGVGHRRLQGTPQPGWPGSATWQPRPPGGS